MNQYLTFSDYQSMGGKLSEPLFVRAEFMARMKIDSLTNNQLQNYDPDDEIWQKVKFLVFELIVVLDNQIKKGKDKQSESQGKMSVTWKDNAGSIDDLIKSYLPALVPSGIIMGRVVRV